MITIRSSDKGIDIRGHSGYAASGTDIVCSAISTLAYTLVKSMDALTRNRISYKMESGNASIRFDYDTLTACGKVIVDSFYVGAEGVAEAYPDYVRIEER